MTDHPPRLNLCSEAIELSLAPQAGARITRLVDRRTGRNWLAGDDERPIPLNADRFDLAAAAGWDECFPSVAACDAAATPWRRLLRDHGEIWGLPWRTVSASAQSATLMFEGPDFVFERRLTLAGETLQADYRVRNAGEHALPFLWSMHPLLALAPGETLELAGVDQLEAIYLSSAPDGSARRSVPWPGGGGCAPFPLDRAQLASACFAGKFFARAPSPGRARIVGARQSLEMQWEGVDHLGVWLTYGAWPTRNDVAHVALEPTTAPFDNLGEAIAADAAEWLAPGAERSWKVGIRLRAPGG